jgi:hypothetical protein
MGDNIVTKDAKYRLLSKLESMARELYEHGDSVSHDESWEQSRSFLWGFADAGKTVEAITSEEVQEVIDTAHREIFGEERLDRIRRLKPAGDSQREPDWDAFDAPTYERKTSASGS